MQHAGGHAALKVPAGTQPGEVLRLREKGVAEFVSARRGDRYMRMRVRVQEQLSREERDLYERLRALRAANTGGKRWRA